MNLNMIAEAIGWVVMFLFALFGVLLMIATLQDLGRNRCPHRPNCFHCSDTVNLVEEEEE